MNRISPEPIACDSCLMPLSYAQFHFHRSHASRGFAMLPYVLCSECYRAEADAERAVVNTFLIRRAGRVSPEWQAGVERALEVHP